MAYVLYHNNNNNTNTNHSSKNSFIDHKLIEDLLLKILKSSNLIKKDFKFMKKPQILDVYLCNV